MNELANTILVQAVPSLTLGVSGWLFGRKQKQAETVGKEISNVENLFKVYESAILRLEESAKRSEEREQRMEIRIDEVKSKLDKAMIEKEELQVRVADLEAKLKHYANH